jgi:glycosyltransferase involved in cell wall biosynthesis
VVVPSVWAEPFPLVVVEALSHGRPVLVTRVGGLPEVVGADAGITSEVDAASLADGLTRLLVDDAAQRSAAARARYEGRFAPGIVTQQLLDIYRDVIDEDSAAAP